jgi:hypothetical protein
VDSKTQEFVQGVNVESYVSEDQIKWFFADNICRNMREINVIDNIIPIDEALCQVYLRYGRLIQTKPISINQINLRYSVHPEWDAEDAPEENYVVSPVWEFMTDDDTNNQVKFLVDAYTGEVI